MYETADSHPVTRREIPKAVSEVLAGSDTWILKSFLAAPASRLVSVRKKMLPRLLIYFMFCEKSLRSLLSVEKFILEIEN